MSISTADLFLAVSPHVADLIITDAGDGRGRAVHYRDEALRRTKVAICGAGGVLEMPWNDPTYECWSLNNFWSTSRDRDGRIAASRWFEQHQIFPDVDGQHAGKAIQNERDMRWIRDCPVPLYTTEPFPENPRALVYDVDALVAKGYRDYFTCSFAYQIALAYDEGFRELLVCGLELLLGTKREATVESSCVNYWLGFVEGRGMKVTLAPQRSSVAFGRMQIDTQWLLAHPYRYGHDYWPEADFVLGYVARWDKLKAAV